MPKNDVVDYKGYLIYPMALYLTAEKKWQPIALLTHETQEGMTLPHSQSFPRIPRTFDDEEAALNFAVQFGQMLIDGSQRGLTI